MLTITSTQTRQTMFGSKERLFKVKCLMFFWSSAFFLLFIHCLFILQLININFLRVQSFNLIHFKYYLSVTICCTDRSSLIFSEILAPWGRKRLPDLFVRYHFQNWKTYLPAANKTSDGNSSASLSEISPMILRKWTEWMIKLHQYFENYWVFCKALRNTNYSLEFKEGKMRKSWENVRV